MRALAREATSERQFSWKERYVYIYMYMRVYTFGARSKKFLSLPDRPKFLYVLRKTGRNFMRDHSSLKLQG